MNNKLRRTNLVAASVLLVLLPFVLFDDAAVFLDFLVSYLFLMALLSPIVVFVIALNRRITFEDGKDIRRFKRAWYVSFGEKHFRVTKLQEVGTKIIHSATA